MFVEWLNQLCRRVRTTSSRIDEGSTFDAIDLYDDHWKKILSTLGVLSSFNQLKLQEL